MEVKDGALQISFQAPRIIGWVSEILPELLRGDIPRFGGLNGSPMMGVRANLGPISGQTLDLLHLLHQVSSTGKLQWVTFDLLRVMIDLEYASEMGLLVTWSDSIRRCALPEITFRLTTCRLVLVLASGWRCCFRLRLINRIHLSFHCMIF